MKDEGQKQLFTDLTPEKATTADNSLYISHRNLIGALLTYPTQASKILHSNQKLIDGDFLQLMEQVSVNMAKAGNSSAADFLDNLANKIRFFLKPARKNRPCRAKRLENMCLELIEEKILDDLTSQQGMHVKQEAIDYIAVCLIQEINNKIEKNEPATLHRNGELIDIQKSILRGAKKGEIIVEQEGIKFNNFSLILRNKTFRYPNRQYKPSQTILQNLLITREKAMSLLTI